MDVARVSPSEEEVGGTIEWAKHELDNFEKAKQDLGPLFDALGQPLTQLVSGVAMLLAGVLNLLSQVVCAFVSGTAHCTDTA